ncbi:MAG: radical SAM protein [bacterium]|nr:radical SAM protein [bacterium]
MLSQIILVTIAIRLFCLRIFRYLLPPGKYISFTEQVVEHLQILSKKLNATFLTRWVIRELQLCYRFHITRANQWSEKKRYNQKLNEIESQQQVLQVYSYPTRMSIEITRNCNLRCQICPQSFLEVDGQEISSDTIDAVKSLIPYQDYIAVFGFGESLTAPHFFDYLARLPFTNEQTVALITNGILMTKEISRQIITSPINVLLISLDTVNPQTYHFIRGVNFLPRLIEHIEQLNELKSQLHTNKPQLRLGFVAMKRNIAELPDFIRFAHRVGAEDVDVGYLNVFREELREESLYYEPELTLRYLLEAKQIAQELNVRLNIPELERFEVTKQGFILREKTKKPCVEPWQFVYINSNGTVTPCCINTSILGDISKTPFSLIWNNELYRRFRKQVNTATAPYRCRYCFDCRYKDIQNINQHMIVLHSA